jgi:hypothetical protein
MSASSSAGLMVIVICLLFVCVLLMAGGSPPSLPAGYHHRASPATVLVDAPCRSCYNYHRLSSEPLGVLAGRRLRASPWAGNPRT